MKNSSLFFNEISKIEIFLSNLGFCYKTDFYQNIELKKALNVDLAYQIGNLPDIYFSYLPESNLTEDMFQLHRNIWNDNRTEVFIVISDQKTFLCASKYKPDRSSPSNCQLKSFEYGINSPGFEPEKIKPLLKENIDFGFFWDFVQKKLKEKKKRVVDDDLLLNLIKLKKDLDSKLTTEKNYILIERCLFIKFLEDRGFLEPKTLIEILESADPRRLLNKFSEINNHLNGDVFEENIFSTQEISQNILRKLFDFFTTDYRNQIQLFPYKFDIIPVELLSSIYEAFLKVEEQVKNGIYYTPSILVDLVLDETLNQKLKKNPIPACIDFTCGSGIFLVKALERIIKINECASDFEKKKKLLENCIFGVERDLVAARITIFSLYLTILDNEDPKKLRESIKRNKIKFPRLLNKNILHKDTLFDDLCFVNEDGIKKDSFDVIIGNPPWGVNPFEDGDRNKKMKLPKEKQEIVNDLQSSQYFILKTEEFMKDTSIAGMVTNNSNFLMGQAEGFRKGILEYYHIKSFFELTQCNSILFDKKKVEELTLGAGEPATVIIFQKKRNGLDKRIKYLNPSLDAISKFLRIILIKDREVKEVPQNLFEKNDQLWRILAVGGLEDFDLLEKLQSRKGGIFTGLRGFELTSSLEFKSILKNVEYVDKDSINHFILIKKQVKKATNIGMKIRRECSGFNELSKKKLLIKRYIEKDLRIKAVYDDIGYRFKDDLLGLLFDYDYRLFLSFYNSSLISYYLCFISAQIGKGTWNMLHKNEIESVPIPLEKNIPTKYRRKLISLTEKILETGEADPDILQEIDEAVFNVYHLKEFEKQRIRDFFYVRSRGKEKKLQVNMEDLKKYVIRFREVFQFILKEDKYLNAQVYPSPILGAGVSFELCHVNKKREVMEIRDASNIKNFIFTVTKKQIKSARRSSLLKQDKVKIYNKDSFTIVKSNQFKDWSETEAIKDANEEIVLYFKRLPEE